MTSHWAIIAAIIAAANAWAIFALGRYLDKRAKAVAKPTKNEAKTDAQAAKRHILLFFGSAIVVSVISMIWLLTRPEIGRLSIFFVFLYSVGASVALTVSLLGYILVDMVERFKQPGPDETNPKEETK